MQNILDTIAPKWYKEPGATAAEIEQLKNQVNFRLPPDYESFLMWSNGGEGYIGSNYFSLWTCEQIPRRNTSTKIGFYLPKVLGIATDGGDYCYALDYRFSEDEPQLVLVPLG